MGKAVSDIHVTKYLFSRPAVEDVYWKDPEASSSGESSDDEDLYDDEGSDHEGCMSDMKDEPRFLSPGRVADGMDFVSSDAVSPVGTQAWKMDTVEKNPVDGMGADGEADESIAAVVASLTDKWEEQEAQVERRRNRRRKQSAEAAMELGRQRRSNPQR